MKRLSEKLKGIVDIEEPYTPKKTKNKELPLLTYYCKYQSSIDDDPTMKIEIFYGNEMKINLRNKGSN